jgi:predicted lipoprotein with Yx(FWY)xxD motif
MTRTRTLPAIAGLSIMLVLAACSSTGSSPSATAQSTPSTAATESAAPSESAPPASEPATGEATVLAADSDFGQILTDADGNTIYFFANDEEGVSNCTGDCLANWPPVEASGTPSAGDGVTAELGTMDRDDGTTQLTVNGYPAYYFAGDQAAGDTTGQGVGDVWWVFGVDGEPIENM